MHEPSVEARRYRPSGRCFSDGHFRALVQAQQLLKHERQLDGSQLERNFFNGSLMVPQIVAFYRCPSHLGRIKTSTTVCCTAKHADIDRTPWKTCDHVQKIVHHSPSA